MKRWLHIIVSLFLVFGLTTGAMAHAAELGSDCSTVVSIDGCAGFSKKSDDKQSDPAKASVVCHGCHGHHVGIPVGAAPAADPVVAVKAVPARSGASPAPPTHSDTFRPPIA